MLHMSISQRGKELGVIQFDFSNNTEAAQNFRYREKCMKISFIILLVILIPMNMIFLIMKWNDYDSKPILVYMCVQATITIIIFLILDYTLRKYHNHEYISIKKSLRLYGLTITLF